MSKSTRESDIANGRVSVSFAIQRAFEHLETQQLLSEQSVPKLRDTLDRFSAFARARFGCEELGAVSHDIARAFIEAPNADGAPAIATMHLRRSSIRLLFRIARELCVAAGDPTLDLALPPRSSLALRPLTDDEIALGRSYSLDTLTSTRASAAWSLAEATASTSEIPNVRVSDVRVDDRRVWLLGATKTEARWGELDEWGCVQLERRLRALPNLNTSRPIVHEGRGSPVSRQASSCIAISGTLVKAGLGSEPDVRPASVAAWVGARLFAAGAPIEEVARRLGKRSLDRTARFIGFNWRADG